jgi:hypothetical protein
MRQLVGKASAVAALSVLCACASSPFYNEARDKQGQALTEATTKVDFSAVVDAQDQRFAALRAVELETLRTRAATQRQLEIAMVASRGPAGDGTLTTRYVQPLLDARIERLVGRPLDLPALDAVLAGVVDDEHADAQVAKALRAFNSTVQMKLADCAAARAAVDGQGNLKPDVQLAIPATRRSSARLLMKDVMQKCQAATATQPVAGDAGGDLQRLAGLQQEAAQRAGAYRSALASDREALAKAAAAYQAEVAAATPRSGEATASARLASAAATLQLAIGTAREAAKLTHPDSFGHAEALARVEALDAVVGALASGSTDLSTLSPEQARAVGLVRLIPGVADDADALITRVRKPRLAPMLLALDQQRLAVQGFEARAALLERRADLRQQQLDAVRGELWALARARRALGPPPSNVKGASVNLGVSLGDAVADAGEGNRRQAALYESLALYFDRVLHQRTRAAELELAFNATTDELVMLQSRSAAAQWGSLLKNMAAVIAEYHAEGIKPAELAEFLKGFGLVTIGVNVGQ